MVVNGRPLKRKRRVTADLYDFLTFPSAGDSFSGSFDGPFRSNIRSFLSRYARQPPPSSIFAPAIFPHLLTWQIAFRIGEIDGRDPTAATAAIVGLDVVEEDVTRSRSVYCDQCRVVGWSGHPVCGKRYHFIIRADSEGSIDGHHQICARCGVLLHSSDLRCKSCNHEVTVDDMEDWVYNQLEATTHLLHGVVHTNGYGHLLRVNGREGGSKFLSGCDIMDFWDRLCKFLRVRKISVMDVSKKYGMEYRLLHAITSGHSWYGDWSYEFGAGSYALTAEKYRAAVDAISGMPLAPFFTHSRATSTHLQDVVSFYWSLCERRLDTVRDLFCFVVGLLHHTHKQVAGLNCKKAGTNALVERWAADEVERVEHAMIKVLLAVGKKQWVSWRALRGAVCRSGKPALLDYCLKGLGGKLFDGSVVLTRCNPETNVVEFRLQDDGNSCGEVAGAPLLPCQRVVSEEQLLHDLKFLYGALLCPETMRNHMPQSKVELAHGSAMKLLDCKQFVNDYESSLTKGPNPFNIRVSCQVQLADQPKDYTAPPPELIILPVTASVADLKMETAKAFQETYVLFKRLQVLELLDYGNVDDSTRVKFLVGLDGTARFRARCHGNVGLNQFRMERGTENWTVDCACGAKDDDGERMLACDACGVWQHTRCAGIHDFEVVPSRFICGRCGKPTRSGSGPAGGQRCKDQQITSMDDGLQPLATVPFSIG